MELESVLGSDSPCELPDGVGRRHGTKPSCLKEVDEVELGVGDQLPEEDCTGDMEIIDGHLRARPLNKFSTSRGRYRFSSGRSVMNLRIMSSSDSKVKVTCGVLMSRPASTPYGDKLSLNVSNFLMIPWLRSLKQRAGS